MSVTVHGVPVLLGVDTSNNNGAALGAAPDIEFRYSKATEGTGFTDSYFAANRHAARAGQLFAAYHFGHHGYGAAQADHFVNVVNVTGGFNGIGAILDVEWVTPSSGPSRGDILAFGQQFSRRVPGKPLVIYTGEGYWRGVLGNWTGLRNVPLIDARYVNGVGSPEQIVQAVTPHYFVSYGGWTHRVIRQFTENATIDGRRPFDANMTEFSLAYLRSVFGITPPPVVRPVARPVAPVKHPFAKLALDGRFDRADVLALQWWVGTHRDGICGRATIQALQHRVGAPSDGIWGRVTTLHLQEYLNRYAVRWWNTRLRLTESFDRPTVSVLQRYLNRLAGY